MIDPIDQLEQSFLNYIDPLGMSSMAAELPKRRKHAMKQIYPDLWVTEPEHPLPELPDLMMHAYLVRQAGNVLFCRSEHHDNRHLLDAGQARRRFVFGSKLVCHQLAEKIVSKFS